MRRIYEVQRNHRRSDCHDSRDDDEDPCCAYPSRLPYLTLQRREHWWDGRILRGLGAPCRGSSGDTCNLDDLLTSVDVREVSKPGDEVRRATDLHARRSFTDRDPFGVDEYKDGCH
ncbi:hypothetical protein GCM10027415_15890 [Humibacter ginsengisoli]